ncbi:MAG: pitrilysin family protein [Candidatus Omnitrophota bacterium]
MHKLTVMENGLSVITSEMENMTSVSLGVWIGVGGRYESREKSGISHLVEHMLFKGTLSRSTKELKQAVEGVGGAFNGFTSDEATCYMVKVPKKHMELGLDVLSDMVLRAKFDPGDLAREKFVIYEEIKMYRDQPAEHVLELLAGLMWPGNALGRSLTGTVQSVDAASREDIINFREEYYHPGNISIVAAGNVGHKKLSACSEKLFCRYPRGNKNVLSPPEIKKDGPRFKFSRGNTKQAHIAMGFYCPVKTDKEKFAVNIMNIILGGNMSSRLFEHLREEQGLCYDISSVYKRYSDVGEVQIHAGVDNEKVVRSVVSIIKELGRISSGMVSRGELSRAKEYMKGQFLLAIEGTSNRMLWLGDRFVVHKRIPEVDAVLKKIDAVTRRDIKNAACGIFSRDFANLALISRTSEKEKETMIRKVRKL